MQKNPFKIFNVEKYSGKQRSRCQGINVRNWNCEIHKMCGNADLVIFINT